MYQYDNITIFADSILIGDDVIAPPAAKGGKQGVKISSGSLMIDRICEAELYDLSNGFTSIVPLRRVTDATLVVMPHICDSIVEHASTPREIVTLARMAAVGIDVDTLALLTSARAMVDSLNNRHLSHEEGLYCGVSDDYPATALPPWTDKSDRTHIMTVEYNLECYRLLKTIERFAPNDSTLAVHTPDMLAHNIKQALWLPNLNGLSPYLYCFPYSIQLNAVDNRGTALAVIDKVMTPQMAAAAIGGSPVTPADVPRIYPQPDGFTDPYREETLALRAIAASRVNNTNALNHAAGLLIQALSTGRHRTGNTPMLDVLLSGIAGIEINDNSLSIKPCKPQWLSKDLVITGLQYHDATLDLTIRGTGNVVSTFAIDGGVTSDNIVPYTLAGHHTITVTLAGASGHDDIHITSPAQMPPPTQLYLEPQNAVELSSQGDVSGNMLYINGALIEVINSTTYDPPHFSSPTWICAVPVATNDICGMSGRPLMFVDKSQCITLGAGQAAETGSKLLSDKKTIRRRRRTVTQLTPSKYEHGVVESTLFHNSTLTFNVNIKEAGRYVADIEYLDGLGIVNPVRKAAERRLMVDGKEAGIFVCPQLPPEKWSPDVDWRAMTGWSNMVGITLPRGKVELTLVAPANEDNGEDDELMLIKTLRLIKL